MRETKRHAADDLASFVMRFPLETFAASRGASSSNAIKRGSNCSWSICLFGPT